MTAYRIARVHWRDTCNIPGWHKAHELDALTKEPLPIMESVGWLIYEGEDFVTLAQSVSQYAAGDLLKIPRAMIVEMFVKDAANE